MADVRDFFAAERTLLAWVRTGLALMGFGFVVARFGLFLREIADVKGLPPPKQFGPALAFGTALVVFGVVVTAWAAVHHAQTIRRLGRGEPLDFRPASFGTVVAGVLATLGAAVAGYLLYDIGQ
jgi:putative membrane protein